MNIFEKLELIQQEYKAPKSEFNSHGNFKYRSVEKMLEALKPIAKKHRTLVKFNDSLVDCANTPHIEAEAILIDLEDIKSSTSAKASAQEAAIQKGMQAAQISGSTSSYARKYALCALLLVDDTDEIDKKEGDQTDWTAEINSAKDGRALVAIFNRMDATQKKEYTDLLSVKKKEIQDATA